jgi:homocysteine S-methyltransferase
MTSILILDGGLGTSLESEHGVKFNSASDPLWSSSLLLSSPSTLLACQRSFAQVPVDVLLTATYQVSAQGFLTTRSAEHPQGVAVEDIPRYLDKAVQIAEEVLSGSTDAKIALSLGPYGACMIPSQEYSGRYDAQHDDAAQLEAWHASRLHLFASVPDLASRVAFVALETVPRRDEIAAMRSALAREPTLRGVPYWVSCLYPGGDAGNPNAEENYRLPDGTSAREAVISMFSSEHGPPPWGIGINCTKTWKLEGILRRYEDAVREMVESGRLQQWPALVLYPDGTSGEIYNTETQVWEKPAAVSGAEQEKPWAEKVAEIVEGTVARGEWSQVLVGGCCMASHRDIKKLRERLLPS